VPRVLPPGLAARFNKDSWPVPPVFSLIQQQGNVTASQMYRVFNMGIGMVVFCSPQDIDELRRLVPEARLIGEVVKQKGENRVIIA
jgi:phosphoribosylformylglycinamidine cyclo-ligase